jgi:hypothetical protein
VKRPALPFILIALLLVAWTLDDPTLLDAPPSEAVALLELAAGLDRPPTASGATRLRTARIAPPPPVDLARGASGPTPLASATPLARATLSFEVRGGHAAAMRTALASDLAYVREISLEDDGDFVITGRATGNLALSLRRRSDGAGFERREASDDPLAFIHSFADDVVESLTGRRSAFASRLTFSRRISPGRKDVFVANADGRHLTRVSSGRGIATLPAFGPAGVFYSVATPTGVFITESGTNDQPIVGGARTNMGARFCAGRLYFASSRDGNTDIYSVRPDGSDESRLTAHAGIDVSPTCVPGGGIAFVSNRLGKPQIFLASGDVGEPERLTSGDTEAQTPALCGRWLAYTEVSDGMRVMLLDRRSGELRRVSPERGREHKDPAFSPDCRMLAWVSADGILIARRDGRLVRMLIPGHAESVRWER